MLTKKLLFNIIVTFSLFSGSYIVAGVKIYPPLLFSVLGFIYYCFFGKLPSLIFLELKWWAFFVLMVLFCFYVEHDETYLFILIRYIFKAVVIPIGCCLFIREVALRLHGEYSENIKDSIFFALIFQLAITALQLIFPAFRSEFNSIIELTDEWMVLAEMGHFRATGLSGLSIYDTSIGYGILYLFFIPWCFSERYALNYKFFFATLFIIVLSLIAGRSGFLLVLFTFFILFVSTNRKLFYSINVCLGLALCLISFITISDSEEVYSFFQFVFEPIFNFIEFGSFETASTNELMNSYLFIPWDVPPLTGMGIWAQPSINAQYATDSGIILNYIAFGIAGLVFVLSYAIHFVIVFNSNIYLPNAIVKSLFLMGFLALIFSFLLKGPIFFSEKIMTAFFLWIIFNDKHISNGRLK
ncbi:hypothetical protein [Aeromonas sp. SrichE-2G]|uniref:hypothetical protein n=1 Tax=Aeromonas sp. SrichE-2G TaxID=2823359 RepID=UPI001B3336BE|nr:hypothetical protein [Aeromonas sp. SrichE-2G]